jgi:hypothetical protein
VRWRRGKIEEKVEDYLIKNLKSSTKRPAYIEKIEAFRLQGEATHEVPPEEPLESSASSSDTTQAADPNPETSLPNKRKRKGDELLMLEAKRLLGAR